MSRINYLKTKPCGKCDVCGINLWAEHGNAPAPHTLPCRLQGCTHESSAKIISFPRSATGSSIALIEG